MYLYLYSLIQWPVHKSVEREEEGTDGVKESIPVFTVPIKSAKHGGTIKTQEVILGIWKC